ncbi:trans-sulfuration enzyme family protein [Desulfolutivibrio sp.]|uniref:trans-sulfuration enzyme family protein n=1 Tax=Desulfolutivibrio sp. TaxID=2773296 RepID=UPI002F963964
MDRAKLHPDTLCARAGEKLDRLVGGVTTPIHTASAYMRAEVDGADAYRYPRYGNIPTQNAPAEKIAALEGAQAGLVAASGMAAEAVALLAVLAAGDHVVFQADLYGGTHHFLSVELPRLGIGYTLVANADAASLEAAVQGNTRAVYVETPSNPLFHVVDLAAVAAVARRRGLVSIADNTFASPINQNPLALGFDLVVHSGTKYLNGHSDLNCGAVVGSQALMDKVRERAVDYGVTLNVYDCFLLERGMKTLALRMARHNESALALAEFLSGHRLVSRVFYPGLPDHPGHAVAARQMRGFGGMLSFELDCSPQRAKKAVASLELILEAVSLGGVESLICFPCETSHAKMPPDERRRQGISDTLIRFSTGIEDAADLMEDLEQAFARAMRDG